AWIHELNTPESGAAQRASTGKLDWVLVGALVLVLTAIGYQQLVPSRPTVTAAPQVSVDAARQASASRAGAISIAVLPFANMSGDAAQDFFSDGMTEEITAALAKIPTLRVVARTSAFQFKGQNLDARVVGQSPNANYLI